jgi:hypothetical protein
VLFLPEDRATSAIRASIIRDWMVLILVPTLEVFNNGDCVFSDSCGVCICMLSLSLSLWCVCDDIEHIIIPAKLSATSFFNELIVNYDWLGVHWTSQSCVLKTVSLP